MLTRNVTPRDRIYATSLSADMTKEAQQIQIPMPGGGVRKLMPQAYKDTSSDSRKNLSSFFAWGKRASERDAFRQAHMTASGIPGVLNLGVMDTAGRPQPFAGFEWNGRQFYTDANGIIKFIEKDYFQTAISLENERVKYVSQMISLVAGQPSENVIALFGFDFYCALAGAETVESPQARQAQALYLDYLTMSGLDQRIVERKAHVFKRYSDAECSPEVMCNFGENDPEWVRAFNKLALLIEYYPTSIITDQGTLNPLDSSGTVHGDSGMNNAGDLSGDDKQVVRRMENANNEGRFPGVSRLAGVRHERRSGRDAAVAFRDAAAAAAPPAAAPGGP